MVIYKYLPIKYARSLISNGSLRIGTLFDYRKIELYGLDIGDDQEGISQTWTNDSETKRSSKEFNSLESEAFCLPDNVQDLTFSGNFVERKNISPNSYIYSTSECFDVFGMRQLGKGSKERYDSCIKINSPDEFFKAITLALKSEFHGNFSCEYSLRSSHHSEFQTHPALLKDFRYEYQRELRAIWYRNNGEHEPLVISIPEISKYCDLIYEEEGKTGAEIAGPGVHKGAEFVQETIALDNNIFTNCQFSKCTFIFTGMGSINLKSNKFDWPTCKWSFHGPAARTATFLSTINREFGEAGKELFEKTITAIRGNS